MSTPTSPKTWKEKLEPYRAELIAGGIVIAAHIVIVSILWESLAHHFGKLLGLLILFSLPLITFCLFALRRLVARLVIGPFKEDLTNRVTHILTRHEATANTRLNDMAAEIVTSTAATCDKMIVKHDATITPKLELMIAKHDQAVSSKLADMARMFETKIASIHFSNAGYEDKYEKMKAKYKDVTFKDVNSINEFTPAEANAVKIGLIKGVQHYVYAIHRVEAFLPLPMDPQDDRNYFNANRRALDNIKYNHPADSDREEYNIHRIFVVSREALEDADRVSKLKSKVREHNDARFDIRMVLKEELEEQPPYEFAIYDNEIALRLGINQLEKRYGEGIVYFDDAVWRDVYSRRYKAIEAESCKPEEFWEKLPEKLNLRSPLTSTGTQQTS